LQAAAELAPARSASPRVHLFYYGWYAAPPLDVAYRHWDQAGHRPPESIAADMRPTLGPYSSRSPSVLRQHMAWARRAGAGVLVASWWGPDSFEDRQLDLLLDAAAAAELGVAIHVEPYVGRTPRRAMSDLAALLDRVGEHAALHRVDGRPVVYVFEALRSPAPAWASAIEAMRGEVSGPLLLGQTTDAGWLDRAGFDGGYPYDILPLFDEAPADAGWPMLAEAFAEHGLIFVPSIGPGYLDDAAVPDGVEEPAAARTRDAGELRTYRRAWASVARLEPPWVTVTSFNEWHEGTQIEPHVDDAGRADLRALDVTAELSARWLDGVRR
jgi:hypothetical protein